MTARVKGNDEMICSSDPFITMTLPAMDASIYKNALVDNMLRDSHIPPQSPEYRGKIYLAQSMIRRRGKKNLRKARNKGNLS
ncbi:hypothetical protein ECG_09225 [Echinococcus granulosus]|uniref:Expressed protein n=1 Tax=Echinococcus granulosus TaxID=6210 RepID=A0A068WU77_ECHGR|nr:hypothetical protein ECG_09225 [Echinococcus granulosus]CDS21181.1 expressed protein [Echinococcus granulosus]